MTPQVGQYYIETQYNSGSKWTIHVVKYNDQVTYKVIQTTSLDKYIIGHSVESTLGDFIRRFRQLTDNEKVELL